VPTDGGMHRGCATWQRVPGSDQIRGRWTSAGAAALPPADRMCQECATYGSDTSITEGTGVLPSILEDEDAFEKADQR